MRGFVFGALALLCAASAAPSQGADWAPTERSARLTESTNAPHVGWQRAVGDAGDDSAYDIWPTGDDGFVITGSTETTRGDLDLFVLKVDSFGKMQWAKTFGGPKVEIGFGVRTLNDGTIFVAGWTQSFGAGEGDFYVLGLNASGDVVFEKTFGGAKEERATALTVTKDGGIAIIGESYSQGAGDSRFYLVKVDAKGTLLWEKTYDDGPLNERGLAVIEATDGGLLLVGNSMDSTSGSSAKVSDGFVVRVDAKGEKIWSRRFGEAAHDIFHHGARLMLGDYLLSGYTQGFGAKGESDVWLVTIDDGGKTLSSSVAGGIGADHNIIVRNGSNGSVVLGGYSNGEGAGGWDAQLFVRKFDGSPQGPYLYGTKQDDGAVSLAATPRGVAVAGYTSGADGKRDVLFFTLPSLR